MRPQHFVRGLAIAAGLVWLWPTAAARAQYSYGYDSLTYGGVPAQSQYYTSGYSSIYTDPSTGVFASDSVAAPKVVAPYTEPPGGVFGRGNAFNYQPPRQAAVRPAQARAAAPTRRRGLFVRSKTRR